MEEEKSSSMGQDKKTSWSKREEFEDGGFKEVTVEKVTNGFIMTEREHYKENGEWEHETEKSIHKSNPFVKLSMAEKLEGYIEGGED